MKINKKLKDKEVLHLNDYDFEEHLIEKILKCLNLNIYNIE